MEDGLAIVIQELIESGELVEVLRKLNMQEPDAFNTLKEIIEDNF